MRIRLSITAIFIAVATSSLALAASAPEPPAAGFTPPPVPGPSSEFQPDFVFSSSSIAGLETLGQGNWRAKAGEIVGVAKPGGTWLVLGKSYQDLAFFSHFRCAGPCNAGLMFRMMKTADGYTGFYVSIGDKDFSIYRITLDSQGHETSRTPLRMVPAFMRVAPPPPAPGTPARTGGLAGRGGRVMHLPVPLPDLAPPAPGLRPSGDWNEITVYTDYDVIRPSLNRGAYDIGAGAMEDEGEGYGPVALHVEEGEVHFKDVGFKDLHQRSWPAATSSPDFRKQVVDPFEYSWGANVADVNHDGILDIIAGPNYFLGPDFNTRGEMWYSPPLNPGREFPSCWYEYGYDFKGDGWPDVICGRNGPIYLYQNPRGENRRWKRFEIARTRGELVLFKDIDGDGKPELIFVDSDYAIAYAKPDPSDATKPWQTFKISENGMGYSHGLAVGDINTDGRMDIVQAAGWWEQPPAAQTGLWKYHPVAFARWSRSENAGGATEVYDVNGDGLPDVVTSLHAHGFGLAWFEQKRGPDGSITFVRHMIMDDFSTKNTGGVTTTEMHGSALADVNGDGIPDFITGKRYWSHLEGETDADAYGAPVLYAWITVRDPKAPGGARFEPELIDNRSGIGAQFIAKDINGDGAVDIVTSNSLGTFVFWGKPRS